MERWTSKITIIQVPQQARNQANLSSKTKNNQSPMGAYIFSFSNILDSIYLEVRSNLIQISCETVSLNVDY